MLKTFHRLLAQSEANRKTVMRMGNIGWFTRFCFWVDPFLLFLFTPLAWMVENVKTSPPKPRVVVEDDDDDDPGTTAWYT